ncbi:hypothetical protein RB195_016647 [Necator americanus]
MLTMCGRKKKRSGGGIQSSSAGRKPSIRSALATKKKVKSIGMDSGSIAEDPPQKQLDETRNKTDCKGSQSKATDSGTDEKKWQVASQTPNADSDQKKQMKPSECQKLEQSGDGYENFGPPPEIAEAHAKADYEGSLIIGEQNDDGGGIKKLSRVNGNKGKNTRKASSRNLDRTQDLSIQLGKKYRTRKSEIAI